MSSNSKPFARWPEFEIKHRDATVKRPGPQPTIPPAAGGEELLQVGDARLGGSAAVGGAIAKAGES